MANDTVESPQAGTLGTRENFLRKWIVDSVNGISDINTNSTLELYEDTQKNVIKCRISDYKTPGRNAYCKTSGCVSSWEAAEFTLANGVISGAPGGMDGEFRITGDKPLAIAWVYDNTQASKTPNLPGGSWNGTED